MDYRQGLLFWYNYTNLQQRTVRQAASFPRQSSNPSSLEFAVRADHPCRTKDFIFRPTSYVWPKHLGDDSR